MPQINRTKPGTPDAIKAQAQRAQELHEQLYGKPKGADAGEAEEPKAQDTHDAGGGGDIQPVKAPESGQTGDSDTTEVSPPTPTPEAPVEKKAPEPEAAEDFALKYKVLQGKYNSEVPRLSAEIRELKEALAELKATRATPKPEEKQPETKKPVVSEQDLADYGEDLVELIQRVARGEVSATTESLIPQINEIKGQVDQSVAERKTTTVYSKLDREVQDWKEVNKSEGFLAWLSESDPYAGDLRQNLLNQAFKEGNATRVAAFFKGYKAEQKMLEKKPDPAPAPVPNAPSSGITLQELAGPVAGASASEVSTQSKQPQPWTRAEIANFYADVQRGVFKHNPERKAQIEASIAAAVANGGIT